MKFIPFIREQIQVEARRDFRSGSWFAFSDILSGLALAAMLALAPLPTFAQHGGGGGGGGSHGGGGGGGSHASGGSGGGHASGGHAAGAPASGGSGAASGGGGHWWNPFHGGGSNAPASSSGTGVAGSTNSGTAGRFAANNNTWQAPPAGANGSAGRNSVTGATVGPRAAIASPPHVPVPPRGRGNGFGGYYPGYPYYGGYGFGLGFGGFYGAYEPCDPFWGCFGYGAGYYGGGAGYGYFGGSFSGGDSGADLSYSAADDMGSSQEPNPSLYAQAPETSGGSGAQTVGPIGKRVIAVLYLKDGSSCAVTDYWLENGKLHYVASYGGENAIDEGALDLQKTVNENAGQGMTFTLRPAPEPAGVVAPQQ
jgi:hypothetical protein